LENARARKPPSPPVTIVKKERAVERIFADQGTIRVQAGAKVRCGARFRSEESARDVFLPSSPRWNAPPRTPALSGRQLELAWNVLVARCAAAAASSPSPCSDRRRRSQTGGTVEWRSLDFLGTVIPRFATWCNPRSPTLRGGNSGLCSDTDKEDIRSSTSHRQQARELHAGNFSSVD